MTQQVPMFTPEEGLISQVDFLDKVARASLPTIVTNKRITYYNVPVAFDIEVSSFYQNGEKRACMYVWQFGILNWVTYGRTWAEYKSFMRVLSTVLDLSENKRLVCYIHNFAYEFQFMRKRFMWSKLFFLEERKPVYGITGGVEYRCSLKLSSKSLKKVGQDLQKYKYEKKMGDLDYSLVRTSKTPLTEVELGYCEADIRVLLAYIQEKIETDGNISLIPLTNTGYVRNFCRKACFSRYGRYRGLMSELTLDAEEYSQLKRGFSGGFTHASAKYNDKILENVGSFDFTSSYPSVMLAEKFPMSKSVLIQHIETEQELDNYLRKYCCLMDVEFKNVVPKNDFDHPISSSRLLKVESPVVDNGRIVSAKSLIITCTEQDYFVFTEFYDWDEINIKKFRVYKKGYLPTAFVKSILELYKRKTTLKDVDGEEVNYMISKNMLNSAYGMAVTDIVRDEIGYENDQFSSTKPDINEAITKYNEGKRRFLFYPWGVWVTAYSRANLFSGILACGKDYIYSDTDSIKILNPDKHWDYINAYNEEINRKLLKAAEFHGIDPSEFSPLNKNGKPKPIGVWDYEGSYDKFKTIGAKRYLVQRGDSYKLTVAGVNKEKARDYIVKSCSNPFDGLHDGLCVPAEYSGRLTLTYIDEPISGEVRDYLGNIGEYEELSCIHMEPSEYKLTLSDEYRDFLNTLFNVREDYW